MKVEVGHMSLPPAPHTHPSIRRLVFTHLQCCRAPGTYRSDPWYDQNSFLCLYEITSWTRWAGCWSLGTAQVPSHICQVGSYQSKCFPLWESLYALLKKLQTTKCVQVQVEPCWKHAVVVCSVMETSPSVCEVMCVESIQQYCGLCSIQIQFQVIWGSHPQLQSSGMQACNSHVAHRTGLKHTYANTPHVFTMHAEFDIELFMQSEMEWQFE